MIKQIAAIGLALGLVSSAQAAFLGRNALNQADPTCTVSGATKCVSFYNDTLDITILNDWNIGRGVWDSSAAVGSAQAIAAAAGLSATGLGGWMLVTGDGNAAAGASNQLKSIWNEVGVGSLDIQFDGVQIGENYWAAQDYLLSQGTAWFFFTYYFYQSWDFQSAYSFFAVAVRPGDVADVPAPATLALLGLGLIGLARQRSSQSTDKGAAR
jgi:hypothetical protein